MAGAPHRTEQNGAGRYTRSSQEIQNEIEEKPSYSPSISDSLRRKTRPRIQAKVM